MKKIADILRNPDTSPIKPTLSSPNRPKDEINISKAKKLTTEIKKEYRISMFLF